LLSLGGELKRREMVSARFGDILSELYLSCAALKRWNDEGRQPDDLPLLAYCMEASFATIETRLDEIIANFPVRPVAWLIRFLIQPLGPRRRGPSDRVTAQCAEIIANPGPARDRLTTDLFKATTEEGEHVDGVALIERAFAMTISVQSIRDRMHAAHTRDIDQAAQQRTITAEEACPGGIDLPRRVQQGRCVIASDIAAPDGHGIERCPVYIIDGSRTPFIKARGKPGNIPP
jgi:acyl-CoA dehydrogenase